MKLFFSLPRHGPSGNTGGPLPDRIPTFTVTGPDSDAVKRIQYGSVEIPVNTGVIRSGERGNYSFPEQLIACNCIRGSVQFGPRWWKGFLGFDDHYRLSRISNTGTCRLWSPWDTPYQWQSLRSFVPFIKFLWNFLSFGVGNNYSVWCSLLPKKPVIRYLSQNHFCILSFSLPFPAFMLRVAVL